MHTQGQLDLELGEGLESAPLLGAVAGDIIGSPYEINNCKRTDFDLLKSWSAFTDDSVLTLATADKLLYGGRYEDVYQQYGRKYPAAGYGSHFFAWMMLDEPEPYDSWGNGSAMRVSPVAWVHDNEAEVLAEAERSAAVTHSHPEGVKGAQAVAWCIFHARSGTAREDIATGVTDRFGYDLQTCTDTIRPSYVFDVSCQGSVPQAIRCFLESVNTEHAIRLAVSLGGDSDTIACIAGAIAQAFYGMDDLPFTVRKACRERMPQHLLSIHDEFCERFVVRA